MSQPWLAAHLAQISCRPTHPLLVLVIIILSFIRLLAYSLITGHRGTNSTGTTANHSDLHNKLPAGSSIETLSARAREESQQQLFPVVLVPLLSVSVEHTLDR